MTDETTTGDNSRSDDNIVFTFADNGQQSFHVGREVGVHNLYAAAAELDSSRTVAGIPLAPLDARRTLTVLFDAEGEPMLRCGPGLFKWDVSSAAGILRLLADMRATGFLMQAEQAARMTSLLVPGRGS